MIDYKKAFSPSFASKTFTTEPIPGINYSFGSKLNLSNIDFNKVNSLSFTPLAFQPGLDFLGGSSGGGWTFITAPEDISWDLANNAQRVDMFGTNNPPVVAGSRGMRDLTLGNALVEGFVRGKQVEAKIEALEKLMNYQLNPSEGFVSVPVYQVWANEKSYGGPEAYYIIKDIKVKETMRDLTGNATRAFVDISLMQVPAYQVNSGRDQASKATAGAQSALIARVNEVNKPVSPSQAATSKVDGKQQSSVGNPNKRSGPNAGGRAQQTNNLPVLDVTKRGQRSVQLNPPSQP
jgi:hypothetical protein